MALKINSSNTERKGPADVPKKGVHKARLVGLTDLGHQPGFYHNGKDIPSAWKVEFTYELPKSKTKDGRPHWVSEEVTVNNYEGQSIVSKMMRRVRILDPDNHSKDGADLTMLLGEPCQVSVEPNAKGYPRMRGPNSVTELGIGETVPPLENPTFSFDMDEPDMETYFNFPEWKQEKIKRALNFPETELYRQLQAEENM